MIASWVKNNWDKVLGLLLAGVIGFFSAIAAIRNEISELNESIVSNKTRIEDHLMPNLRRWELNTIGISEVQIQIRDIILPAVGDLPDKLAQIEIRLGQFEIYMANNTPALPAIRKP